MTFFTLLGMAVLFVIGLVFILAGVIIPMYCAAWNGKFRKGELLMGLIAFIIGGSFMYFVFSHLTISVG